MTTPLDRLTTALADRYTIESEIGAGGMATVYLAHDLKHDRKVAVKVLRPDIAATLGADRFLREVHIAANLTHPHVLGLHDSGEADGFLYYVMPFIEGESLRERIDREGELPVHDAIKIIKEIVDALGYAHAHNVVHRDIKPDNVLISGRHAMVTDFGVAKAVSEATGRDKLTTAGVALGTPSYMAPEQATAEPHIDHRADIYAVGIVAYELLTGQLPFTGTTQQQLLAAHITEVPRPPSALRPALSASIDQFVLKCLEKRPSDRWQTAEEMLPVLEGLSTPTAGVTPVATAPVSGVAPPPTRSMRVPVLTGVVVAAAVVGFMGWSSLRSGEPSVTVSNIRQLTRAPEIELEPTVSPDGGEVAYIAGVGVDMHVYVQDLGGGRPIALTAERPGTQEFPRWTSDGRNILFFEYRSADRDGGTTIVGGHNGIGTSFLIPRFGGPVTAIANGTVWGEWDGRITYQRRDSIFAQSIGGGDIDFVAELPQSHSFAWSPDGTRLAYVVGNGEFIDLLFLGNTAPSAIWIVATDGSDPVQVTDHRSLNVSPTWLPDGRHLLFVSDRDGGRDIYTMRVDGSGRAAGQPVRVTTGLDPHSLSVSADGSVLAYSRFTFRRNVWQIAIPETGSAALSQATSLTVGNQLVENIAVSHDGEWLVYDSNLEGNQDVYLMPIAGGEPRRLTTNPAHEFAPDMSWDGREVVFHSPRHGTRDIFLVSVAGGDEVRLTDLPEEEYFPTFSPDGLHVAFQSIGSGLGDVFVVSRESIGGPWSRPMQVTRAGGDVPRWSPNGSDIAYLTPNGIGVASLDGDDRTVLVGSLVGLNSIDNPVWSEDGQSIYFTAADSADAMGLYVIPIAGGHPELKVRYDDPTRPVWRVFAVSDGKLFVTIAEYESDISVMDLEFR